MRGVVLDGALYRTRGVMESMVANRLRSALCSSPGKGRSSAAAGARMSLPRRWGSWAWRAASPPSSPPHNIRVNVVSPGSIDTSRANPEWYQGRPPSATGIPLGRQGTVDEIAATCLFLVSDDGGFVTGQTIHVNGGVAYY